MFLLAFLKSFQSNLQPDFFWITFLWDSVGASTHGLKFLSTHSRMFQNSPISIFLFRVYQVNPLRPIGSPVTHENLPTNWPNFSASPALLGWPARNRHTAACIHRFSHILRWPPEPVVWFMSESRAVANEHEGYKQTLSIISSSFWMAVGLKG